MKYRTLLALSLMTITQLSEAQELIHLQDGKQVPVTKGQAIIILASNPRAKIIRVQHLELDMTKGTLKVKKD